MSKTAKAIAWILADQKKRTAYAASKEFRLSLGALSRALKVRLSQVPCPTCGTLHPKGTRFKS